jgi:hypothetical protein
MRKKVLDSLQPRYRQDWKLRSYVEQEKKTKPYVDSDMCKVFWGTDADQRKEKATDGV